MGGKEPEESSLANDIIKLIFKKQKILLIEMGHPHNCIWYLEVAFPLEMRIKHLLALATGALLDCVKCS